MMRNACLLLGLAAAATVCAGQGRGSVKVTVLGDGDKPVSGAQVLARPITKCVLAYALPECLTDGAGRCTLTLTYGGDCDDGKYSISASKVEDAYPRPHEWYFAPPDPVLKEAQVELSAGHSTDAVTVHLGRRAGVLRGTVTDAVTGKGLNATVEFRSVANPEKSIKMTGWTTAKTAKFRMLIPSDMPITMVVSEAGYEDWTYALGKGATKNIIRFRPGEQLTLDIRLRPKK